MLWGALQANNRTSLLEIVMDSVPKGSVRPSFP